MSKVLVTDTYLTNIADAIRDKNGFTTKYKPSAMANAISALDTSGGSGETSTVAEWTRPDTWQDLDAIDMSDFEGIYATYEVNSDYENFISMYGGTLTIEEVTVSSDGTVSVVQEIETTVASNITRADINSLTEGYHTFRITGFSVGFYLQSSYGVNGTGTVGAQIQKIMEMYIRLPNVSVSCAYGYYWTTRSAEHIKFMDTALTNSNTNTTGANGSCFTNANNLEKLEFDNTTVTCTSSCASMFSGCYALTNLDLSGFDTSSVTSMANMFYNCYALTSLDLSNFDTSSVTSMANMFSGCYALTNLDLSGFDTSSVTSMTNMFQYCYALTNLDLSGFDTSSVTSMASMFQYCYALTNLDLSGYFKVAATNTSWLNGASALINLTIGAFANSFSISQSTLYSAETLVAILTALATVTSTCTITIGSTNKAKLTDEQIAIATNKGWTVA